MTHIEYTNPPFIISTDPDRIDIDRVHGWLAGSYWAKGIPRDIVAKSLKHSLCFGIYHAAAGQAGICRVITDFATFAYLADVFIDPAYRGHSLGKWMMQTVVEHPELQTVRGFYLFTADAHGLYEQYGWQVAEADGRFMFKKVHSYE